MAERRKRERDTRDRSYDGMAGIDIGNDTAEYLNYREIAARAGLSFQRVQQLVEGKNAVTPGAIRKLWLQGVRRL